MRASGRLNIIDGEELRLSLEEVRGIAKIRSLKKLSDRCLKALHEKTRGWVAGLAMLLKSRMVANLDEPLYASGKTPEEIFDYLTTEVFDLLKQDSREFLLKTSLLPQITPQMARALTGNKNTERILSYLNRDDFFVEREDLTNGEVIYQYHPLFREFLLHSANDIFTVEVMGRLKRKGAKLLLKSGQIDSSANLFIECRDWQGLTGLIRKHGYRLLDQGRSGVLMEWIKEVPDRVLARSPWLNYWHGSACFQFDPAEALSGFERAYNLFNKADNHTGMIISVSGVISSVTYQFKDFTLLDKWIDILTGLEKKHKGALARSIEELIVSSVFLAFAWRQPDHPNLKKWEKRAHKILNNTSTDTNLRISTGNNLLHHYNWQGDLANGSLVLNKVKRLASQSETPPLSLIMAKTTEAMHAFLTADYKHCEQAAKEGLKRSRTNGIHIFDAQLSGFHCMSALIREDVKEAEKQLARMEKSMQSSQATNLDLVLYHFLAYRIAVLTNDMQGMALHMDKHAQVSASLGAMMPKAISFFGRAELLHMHGEYKKALSLIEKTCETGCRMRSYMVAFMCSVTRAQFALTAGKEKLGLNSLKDAFALGRERGYVKYLAMELGRYGRVVRHCY